MFGSPLKNTSTLFVSVPHWSRHLEPTNHNSLSIPLFSQHCSRSVPLCYKSIDNKQRLLFWSSFVVRNVKYTNNYTRPEKKLNEGTRSTINSKLVYQTDDCLCCVYLGVPAKSVYCCLVSMSLGFISAYSPGGNSQSMMDTSKWEFSKHARKKYVLKLLLCRIERGFRKLISLGVLLF